MTKVAEKPYPFGAAHTHLAHVKEFSAPRHFLTCAIRKSNIRLGFSLEFQWLLNYYAYTCVILILIGTSD